MALIKYGNFTFPTDSSYGNTFSISDQAVNINGSVDKFSTQIIINGLVTATGTAGGDDLTKLNTEKNKIVSGCSAQSFVDLDIDGTIFPLSKMDTISFPDGEYHNFLPYSVSFSSTTEDTFTKFSGISDPQDNWQFTSNNLVVSATHTISAVGENTGVDDPIDNAISFVNDRRGSNLNTVSTFYQMDQGGYHLVGTSENIDRYNGSYSIIDKYEFMESGSYTPSGIFNCSVDSSYSSKDGFKANVNGSIKGGLNTGLVSAGDLSFDDASGIFSFADATGLAGSYLNPSKSSSEQYAVGELIQDTFSYTIDEEANEIDFSFSLIEKDSNDVITTDFGNVLHEKSISISVSKENGSVVTTNIDGTLRYSGKDNPIQTGQEENSERWKAISAAFLTIDPFALANTRYIEFKTEFAVIYSITNQNLNPKQTQYNINKDLKETSISYSYSYTDKLDPAALYPNLKDVKLSITNDVSFEKKTIKETIAGFSEQTISDGFGVISVKATASSDIVELPNLITVAEAELNGEGFWVRDSSKTIDEDSMSYSISKYYK